MNNNYLINIDIVLNVYMIKQNLNREGRLTKNKSVLFLIYIILIFLIKIISFSDVLRCLILFMMTKSFISTFVKFGSFALGLCHVLRI